MIKYSKKCDDNWGKGGDTLGVKPKVASIFLVMWVILVPVGMYITFLLFPPTIHNWLDAVSLFLLSATAAIFPIIINGTPIFLAQWVTLAAFLSYGLFFEMVMMQLTVLLLMFRLRVGINELHRYAINSIMFFFSSLLSGLLFYALGGAEESISITKLFLLIVCYGLSYFLLNHSFLTLFFRALGIKRSLISEDVLWEALIVTIIVPLGMSLYYLFESMGWIATLLLGIPMLSASLVLKLYNSSEKLNASLQQVVDIGHQLTEKLFVNEVLDIFIQKISQTLPVEYAYILDVNQNELVVIRRVEKGELKSNDIPPIKQNEGIVGQVWATKKAVNYSTRLEWKEVVQGYMPEHVESVLSVPIMRANKVVGVLLLASTKKRAYSKYHLMIADILCSYLAVAIENARHYEHTKRDSEICPLTKAYNYRYLERLLNDEFTKLKYRKRSSLSLIILDIDHFKAVNDTYGHEAGNEILCTLAERLKNLIGDEGVVVRYGGEEFIIYLPEKEKEEALSLAEKVREHIANSPFVIYNNLSKERNRVIIRITASIGLATAPDDASDYLTLIRHADRAMYIGAKKAGRNKVATYVK